MGINARRPHFPRLPGELRRTSFLPLPEFHDPHAQLCRRPARALLAPYRFGAREPRDTDVVIEILYRGACHSDLHTARDEEGAGSSSIMPGHETVGRVPCVGKAESKFNEGDIAAVGCVVDASRECANCQDDLEQFCLQGATFTMPARAASTAA